MNQPFIRFLGSGDAFGSGGRDQTCIYVDFGAARLLLDCGASALISMKRWGIPPSGIDTILITHLHGDHFSGIPFFLLEAQLISKRTEPLVIAGPPSLESRIRAAREVLFPGSSGIKLKFPIQYLEFTPQSPVHIGPLTVSSFPVAHESGAPSMALRLECGGKAIGYSGDTEWTDSLLRAAEGTDLFICEAYFFDKKIPYHLDYRTLLSRRAELGCKRLILTHMSEDMLERSGDLEVETAEDGKIAAF